MPPLTSADVQRKIQNMVDETCARCIRHECDHCAFAVRRPMIDEHCRDDKEVPEGITVRVVAPTQRSQNIGWVEVENEDNG